MQLNILRNPRSLPQYCGYLFSTSILLLGGCQGNGNVNASLANQLPTNIVENAEQKISEPRMTAAQSVTDDVAQTQPTKPQQFTLIEQPTSAPKNTQLTPTPESTPPPPTEQTKSTPRSTLPPPTEQPKSPPRSTQSPPTEQPTSVPKSTQPTDTELPASAEKSAKAVTLKAPVLPAHEFDIRAPKSYQHPLANAHKIIFMLGEDKAGNYLYGEGPLLAGTYEKMLRYINFYKKKNINLNRLMLHSPGGLVNEGLLIGNYVRQHNWTTDSDKYMRCYSSCGFIFASGVKKRIQQGAEIGFHRPYDPAKSDTPYFIEQVYQEYKPYWRYIQGDPALYDLFMKQYGRDQMYIMRADTIGRYMQVEVY